MKRSALVARFSQKGQKRHQLKKQEKKDESLEEESQSPEGSFEMLEDSDVEVESQIPVPQPAKKATPIVVKKPKMEAVPVVTADVLAQSMDPKSASHLFALQAKELVDSVCSISKAEKKEKNRVLRDILSTLAHVKPATIKASKEEIEALKLSGRCSVKMESCEVNHLAAWTSLRTEDDHHTVLLALQLPPALLTRTDFQSDACLDKIKLYLSRLSRFLQDLPGIASVSLSEDVIPNLVVSLIRGSVVLTPIPPAFPKPAKFKPQNAVYNALGSSSSMVLLLQQQLPNIDASLDEFFCHDVFKQTHVLIQVWLRQRDLTAFLPPLQCALFMLYLNQNRKFSLRMPVYQMFRIFLLHLGDLKAGVSMATDSPILATYQTHYDVTFLDSTGYLNLLFFLRRHHLDELLFEAEKTLNSFDRAENNQFQSAFLTRLDFQTRFDYTLNISMETSEEVEKKLVSVLRRALGDRAVLIALRRHATYFRLGVLLDSKNSRRILDVGPAADSAEAASFREFWGEKSELRRFQDGTIAEACLWDYPLEERHKITNDICKHALKHHFDVAEKDIHSFAMAFDFALLPRLKDHTQELYAAFEQLNKKLRSLRLPLQFADIQPVHPAFRYTSAVAPQKVGDRRKSHFYDVLPILLKFERSSSWPDELPAIRAVKTAFYLQISLGLSKAFQLPASATADYCEVIESEFPFRLYIQYDQELTLAIQTNHAKGEKLMLFYRHLLTAQSVVHSLHNRYPAFGPTVRLAKRWISSHLLAPHFREEAIELMVGYVFCHYGTYGPPDSHANGFTRFLSFLAYFDFSQTPLLVDTEKEMTEEAKLAIVEKWARRDKSPTSAAIYLATAAHPEQSVWTQSPISAVLARTQSLARSSVRLLAELSQGNQDVSTIFQPSYEHYDVLIKLSPAQIWRVNERLQPLRRPPFHHVHTSQPLAFDPVAIFVKKLQKRLRSLALVFVDELGGDYVGLVWNPLAFVAKPTGTALPPQALSLLLPLKYDSGAVAASGKPRPHCVPNIFSLIADIQHLGGDLVERIELKSGRSPRKI